MSMRDLAGYPGATRDELVAAVPAAPQVRWAWQFRADRAMTAPEVPVDRVPGQITSVVLSG
jgi:hypothetical protein